MSTQRSCPQCGAEVSFEGDRLAQVCAFCETPLVASAGGGPEPVDAVVPFALDQKVSAGRLAVFLQDARWAPEAVRRIRPEALKSVLIPFYTYDATARSTYTGRVGVFWHRTQTYVSNGKVRTRTIRETEWFKVSGSHVHVYKDHIVSGSKGLPEAEANALEPFDLGAALPYAPALVAGLTAELPTVDHARAQETARAELAEAENRMIAAFLPGDQVSDVQNQTEVAVGAVRLVLLPVWIATYRHAGKVFRLLVNGQTGEVVGEVPRSTLKIVLAVLLGLTLLLSCGCLALLISAAGGG